MKIFTGNEKNHIFARVVRSYMPFEKITQNK